MRKPHSLTPGPKRSAPRTPLAKAIQARLEVLGWTNADLARRLELPIPCITRWVSGQIKPTVDSLAKIAAALDVKLDSLVAKPSIPKR
jgi:ribosome-binding protein aMBF1 (putative translation factor)